MEADSQGNQLFLFCYSPSLDIEAEKGVKIFAEEIGEDSQPYSFTGGP
jgi:hypothetical protein